MILNYKLGIKHYFIYGHVLAADAPTNNQYTM